MAAYHLGDLHSGVISDRSSSLAANTLPPSFLPPSFLPSNKSSVDHILLQNTVHQDSDEDEDEKDHEE